MVKINRFEVFLVTLDPTHGSEINKTRPCLIISPNEMNHYINTVIVAPMTTKSRDYPTRIPVTFIRKKGFIVLDQIRTVDKERLVKKLGVIKESEAKQTLQALQEMFAAL
ncbi:MAG: type II toxin-antitoxin system PemK/MazF family toxin [Candidatus Babeliales bacterium]|nr:type II toxin-antitoxin system PemK/MazF family toxin [Candidatus Babeliales bacterium]